MHLIVDGKCKNRLLLTSEEALSNWLEIVVDFIGMTVIGGPYVLFYPAGNGKDRGLTGIVVLAESHVAVHTFPEYEEVDIDIYSCKSFDYGRTLKRIEEDFEMVRPAVYLLPRRELL